MRGSASRSRSALPQSCTRVCAKMAAQRGTSVSQLSADLLAIAVGHPEAVRELDKEVLPLAM
ncbi:toxin-antitoxin system [Mycolicibacterium novocastrense]|nr:toxin-antitoxin system [Mycolicibacterium novocastrense]